jgi:hypothetical protein
MDLHYIHPVPKSKMVELYLRSPICILGIVPYYVQGQRYLFTLYESRYPGFKAWGIIDRKVKRYLMPPTVLTLLLFVFIGTTGPSKQRLTPTGQKSENIFCVHRAQFVTSLRVN